MSMVFIENDKTVRRDWLIRKSIVQLDGLWRAVDADKDMAPAGLAFRGVMDDSPFLAGCLGKNGAQVDPFIQVSLDLG